MTTPVTRQAYEARIDSEMSRLLDIKKEWTTLVATITHLRNRQQISNDVYTVVLAAAEKAMTPVNRHLQQLRKMRKMSKDVKVRLAPSRRLDDPDPEDLVDEPTQGNGQEPSSRFD